MSWPSGIRVGHTSPKSGRRMITLNSVELSPGEARAVATELQLRADFQDRTSDTRLIDEVPRRVSAETWRDDGAEGEAVHRLCDALETREDQRPNVVITGDPVVWADDVSPFTGPQVLSLLRENEELRKRIRALLEKEVAREHERRLRRGT